LHTVLFILDIYIVNQLGSPQWYQSLVFDPSFWCLDSWSKFCFPWQRHCRPLATQIFRVRRTLVLDQNLAFGHSKLRTISTARKLEELEIKKKIKKKNKTLAFRRNPYRKEVKLPIFLQSIPLLVFCNPFNELI
jgi:hypothetical protein